MNTFANAITNNATVTTTENGDKTYTTSLDACVDLFFKIAAIRGRGAQVASDLFDKAYYQNPDLATRIALWARDVRGGAGERQVFRDLLVHLEKNDFERLERILPIVPEVGRWDDLFVLTSKRIREQVLSMFAYALNDENGLAAKWAPRENSKNKKFANDLREFMNLSWPAYRKLISRLSKTVEQQMCAQEWDMINFSHVPSVASARYSKAFWKHQNDRYAEFVQKAVKGEAKINTSALFPYDCLKSNVDEQTANALWKQLPDYVPEGVSFLPVIDTSASMTWTAISPGLYPMTVATSLGIYMAERNKSAFKNLMMTFSSTPAFVRIPETNSIRAKQQTVLRADVGGGTNLDAAMKLILDTAIQNNVSQSDMPDFLIVFSDMEFNPSPYGGYGSSSVVDRTKEAFANAGYKIPNIVWWNIQSRGTTTPVRFDENGMVLVSGCSPTVTKSVLGADIDPKKTMLNTVMVERYEH